MIQHPLANDLGHILDHTEPHWRDLAGSRILFTGGTGLFGVWILESMVWAQKKLGVSFQVKVLSRNPESFLKNHPQFQDQPFLTFHRGEVTTTTLPAGEFTHFLHGATTSAHETFHKEQPLKKFSTVADGTRRMLEFAEQRRIPNFLLMSSGSACGQQPDAMPLMLEDYHGAPDTTDPVAALGHAKRVAEFLCAAYAESTAVKPKIARCFSFLGPYLPLDIHYAVGNFIADGLAGKPVLVKGDGSPIRSYLYMSDLVIWLMTILMKGKTARVYHVGSEDGRSIADIARAVASAFEPQLQVKFSETPTPAPATAASNRYVPSTKRAIDELGLKQWVSLEEGIGKTIAFHRCVSP